MKKSIEGDCYMEEGIKDLLENTQAYLDEILTSQCVDFSKLEREIEELLNCIAQTIWKNKWKNKKK